MDHIHPEARTEEREGHQQQQNALVPAIARQHEPLRRRGKDQHGNGCHHEDHNALQEGHIDQQQVSVEDEQERQRGSPQAVVKGLETGTQRISPRYGGGSEGGQPHRRRDVGHDAEIEHEQVHGNQWHQ